MNVITERPEDKTIFVKAEFIANASLEHVPAEVTFRMHEGKCKEGDLCLTIDKKASFILARYKKGILSVGRIIAMDLPMEANDKVMIRDYHIFKGKFKSSIGYLHFRDGEAVIRKYEKYLADLDKKCSEQS